MGDAASSANIEKGKIIGVVAVVVFLLAVLFVLFLQLYAKRFWYSREEEAFPAAATAAVSTRLRGRFDFAPGHTEVPATGLRRGLDPSVLKSQPVVIFDAKKFKDGLECAVCLSALADGEKARLLPKCNHGFHVVCIDKWFQSHRTCPLCRNPVSSLASETILHHSPILAENSSVAESPNFPTNVLFWGNQTQVSTLGSSEEDIRQPLPPPPPPPLPSSSSSSSSSTSHRADGMLVLDIPGEIADDEEQKSPVTYRLRSLRRLLNG